MTFDDLNLNSPLREALADLEYIYPTPIQVQSLPVIMSGKDVIGVAQTGTGKTFAYLLPILRNYKYVKSNQPRYLIVVPTRELVIQVENEANKLAKYMNLKVGGVYGGTNINTQKLIIVQGIDLLVATPGRLADLVYHGVLKLNNIKTLVIDEVDEMFNLGFRTQLYNIFDLLPPKRQNLMFSATLNADIQKVIDEFFYSPTKIEIARHGATLEKIDQKEYKTANFKTKTALLQWLLKDPTEFSKVLVFAGKKRWADMVFEALNTLLPSQIGVIHSNKSQNFRNRNVAWFHDGRIRILVATDIIARGLDFADISHVINFDTPDVAVNYIHRIGRTGRAETNGTAITFVAPYEEDNKLRIEELMQKEIETLPFPDEVTVSTELLPEEQERHNQKNYLKEIDLSKSQGAFHKKSDKNMKVNRAQEKRNARKQQKRSAKRKKRK